ncbi:MAG TPA: hypothetical protein VE130_07370 [Nitrososphaeraceae archaeon]|nr:hypothetical protein [Nitrososphaeraceae archaeon]
MLFITPFGTEDGFTLLHLTRHRIFSGVLTIAESAEGSKWQMKGIGEVLFAYSLLFKP